MRSSRREVAVGRLTGWVAGAPGVAGAMPLSSCPHRPWVVSGACVAGDWRLLSSTVARPGSVGRPLLATAMFHSKSCLALPAPVLSPLPWPQRGSSFALALPMLHCPAPSPLSVALPECVPCARRPPRLGAIRHKELLRQSQARCVAVSSPAPGSTTPSPRFSRRPCALLLPGPASPRTRRHAAIARLTSSHLQRRRGAG